MAETVFAAGAAFDLSCSQLKRGNCMDYDFIPEDTDRDEGEFLIDTEDFYDLLMEQQEQM